MRVEATSSGQTSGGTSRHGLAPAWHAKVQHHTRVLLAPFLESEGSFNNVNVDLVGLLHPSRGFTRLLIVVDRNICSPVYLIHQQRWPGHSSRTGLPNQFSISIHQIRAYINRNSKSCTEAFSGDKKSMSVSVRYILLYIVMKWIKSQICYRARMCCYSLEQSKAFMGNENICNCIDVIFFLENIRLQFGVLFLLKMAYSITRQGRSWSIYVALWMDHITLTQVL